MFGIGMGEFIMIMIVGLIVFGPSELPRLGKSLGKAIREFRKAQSTLTNALAETEAQINPMSPPKSAAATSNQSTNQAADRSSEQPKTARTTVDDVTQMINANPITVPDTKINLAKPDAKET